MNKPLFTLDQVKTQMQAALAKHAPSVEVTFINAHEFSLATDSRAEHDAAVLAMTGVNGAKLMASEHDDECGSFAYYRF